MMDLNFSVQKYAEFHKSIVFVLFLSLLSLLCV